LSFLLDSRWSITLLGMVQGGNGSVVVINFIITITVIIYIYWIPAFAGMTVGYAGMAVLLL
jgi:hypothetical protein